VTNQQLEQIIKILKAGYPAHPELPAETLLLWARSFEGSDYGACLEAVKLCHESERFFPSIAQFRQYIREARVKFGQVRAVEDRMALEQTSGPPLSKDESRAIIAGIRETVENAEPWRVDPVTGEKVYLPKSIPGFKSAVPER
jgi:hypothetical protein